MAEISNTSCHVCACDRCGAVSVQRYCFAKGESESVIEGEKLVTLEIGRDSAWTLARVTPQEREEFRNGLRSKHYMFCSGCAYAFDTMLSEFLANESKVKS